MRAATGERMPGLVNSSAANWWSSKHGVPTFFKVESDLLASSKYLSTHCSACPVILYCQPRTGASDVDAADSPTFQIQPSFGFFFLGGGGPRGELNRFTHESDGLPSTDEQVLPATKRKRAR